MQIRSLRALRGPNVWSRFPALEVVVDLQEWAAVPLHDLRGCQDRLLGWVPGLAQQRSVSDRASFGELLGNDVSLAHALERIALHLQTLVSKPVASGQTLTTAERGVYRVVVQYRDEALARACVETACKLCEAAAAGQSYDAESELVRLRGLADTVGLSPSAAAIAEEAQGRDVPVRRPYNTRLIQFGHGANQHWMCGAETDRTGALAKTIADDRELTRDLLRAAGIPVVEGRTVASADDAWAAAQELGLPAVVRPRNGSDLPGVDLGLATPDQVRHAYEELSRRGEVSVERCPMGHSFLFLVVASRVVAVARLDERASRLSASDVTDRTHDEIRARVGEATRVVGLDLATVEVVAADVARPLEEQGGVIVRVDGEPDLDFFVAPWAEKLPVAEAIVDHLIPSGQTGRIPIAAVTGVNGKTTTTRLIAGIFAASGRRVGLTCTDGVYVDGRRVAVGDCSGPRSARDVLVNPRVEAAAFEVARGGVLREGLGFDHCDVAVVTNIGEGDHLGISWVETADDLARVKGTLVEAVAPGGTAVLNATDPLVTAMAKRCRGDVIYFCLDGEHPIVRRHRQAGGRATFVRDGVVVQATGEREAPLVPLTEVPLTRQGRIGFQVENVLAATAAAWSLGIDAEAVRATLATFDSDLKQTPGRFNVLEVDGATVILDYGHNPSAVAALIASLDQFPAQRRTVVYAADGDRRNDQIIRQAELIGNAFDRVILYEEGSRQRGRAAGECFELLRRGLSAATRAKEIVEIDGELAAIEMALRGLSPSELVLIQVDAVDADLQFVRNYLAQRQRA